MQLFSSPSENCFIREHFYFGFTFVFFFCSSKTIYSRHENILLVLSFVNADNFLQWCYPWYLAVVVVMSSRHWEIRPVLSLGWSPLWMSVPLQGWQRCWSKTPRNSARKTWGKVDATQWSYSFSWSWYIHATSSNLLLYFVTTLFPFCTLSSPACCHDISCIAWQSMSFFLSVFHFNSAICCGSVAGLQNRQIKEALFIKKVQQNVKEEQANHMRW